jgi:uncharacterized CHY-type Zn-finger protein
MHQQNRTLTEYELKEINKFRKKIGLEAIEPKKIKCMICKETFDSVDFKSNRICWYCKKKEKQKLEARKI